jgi:hypothetical protein
MISDRENNRDFIEQCTDVCKQCMSRGCPTASLANISSCLAVFRSGKLASQPQSLKESPSTPLDPRFSPTTATRLFKEEKLMSRACRILPNHVELFTSVFKLLARAAPAPCSSSALRTRAAHRAACPRWLPVYKQQPTRKQACRTVRQPYRKHIEHFRPPRPLFDVVCRKQC